jgi:carboxymethylenebutenolidase
MCFKEDECGPRSGRRAFLAGSAATAAVAAVPALAQGALVPASAPTRVLDNINVVHGPVTFTHNGQPSLDGYLARPKAEGRYPGVIVIAGNRISEEYIPNTCAALALAGFVGLAPNLYHIVPENVLNNAEIAAASANHTDDDVLMDMLAGMDYLRRQPFASAQGFAALGFCYGGRMAMKLGARSREIDAVVAFHPAPRLTAPEIERLSCPVQIHVGTIDQAAPVAMVSELNQILKRQGTPTELHIYEGADHGFLAYTRPHRYNPRAAQRAWARTTDFLKQKLGARSRAAAT